METQAQSNNTTLAILCWIFAPFLGIFLLNHEDESVKWHAKKTMNYGLAAIVIYIGLAVFTFVIAFVLPIGLLLSCLQGLWFLADMGIRIYGALQASRGIKWEVPVISEILK